MMRDTRCDNQNLSALRLESKQHITMQTMLSKLKDQNDFERLLNGAKIKATEVYYQIQLSDNNTTWIIRKTLAQFLELDHKIRKDSSNPINASLEQFKRRESIDHDQLNGVLISYIQEILRNDQISGLKVVKTFLSQSDVSVIGSRKYKEAYLKKRSGGRYKQNTLARCAQCFNQWKRRYFVITSEGLMISLKDSGPDAKVREMLLFDYNLRVEYDPQITGIKNGIVIRTNTRDLYLQAYDEETFVMFLVDLFEAYKFDSFAPIRTNVKAEWFVDGERYYDSVCDAFMAAKNEIFITDWWLSPQLYLKRPVGEHYNQEFRLDRVLERKAKEGVKIYAILYNEPKIALTINSEYTQKYLSTLHPNIMVLRHPNYILPLMWSHHEKIIVVDQVIAYIGGLDLCYGRMDTQCHELDDPIVSVDAEDCEFFPGIDYSNARLRDFKNVQMFLVSDISRNEDPRMPWHDISMKIQGSAVRDVCRHFIQYWNFACVDLNQKGKYRVLQLQEQEQLQQEEGEDLIKKYKDKVKEWSHTMGEFFKTKFSKQKEPQNSQVRQSLRNRHSSRSTSQFQRELVHKQPEQDSSEIDVRLSQKQKSIRRTTVGTNFQLGIMDSSSRSHLDLYIDSMRVKNRDHIQTIEEEESKTSPTQRSFIQDDNVLEMLLNLRNDASVENFLTPSKYGSGQIERAPNVANVQEQGILLSYKDSQVQGTCTVQVCRSSSNWSIGLSARNTELSIQIAYLQLITQAEHFIYIENQFFISSVAGYPVKNQIVEALVQRIKKAAHNKEIFRVVIVMPLLPGFQGEIDSESSNVMKIQLYWEYLSISRGSRSLMKQLADDPDIKDPSDYIVFIGLRTHKIINNKPQTEIIYVHSKLMIVDDKIVVCGSANLNDRSMMGTRDSEIALVIEDQKGLFGHTLRKNLYNEHFGIPEDSPLLQDPASPDLHNFILQRIEQNTMIYRQIFACYPDDEISELRQMNEFRKKSNLQSYAELHNQIKGHAVQFPTKFLCNESLKFPVYSKEYLCPEINFT